MGNEQEIMRFTKKMHIKFRLQDSPTSIGFQSVSLVTPCPLVGVVGT